ncbi:MAG: DegT/DnrJ/EryC1/StrS family aminotransferase [Candidatus Cyclobacteriaceae bacterium M3_2C_046]
MKINFNDLKSQQDKIRQDINQRMQTVLQHGKYIMGPEVYELEEKLEEYTDRKHCITCSSGTDALLMSLMALNIGPGDRVITSPFTFIATAEVIQLVGARPHFVDIDADTYNLDPAKLNMLLDQLEKEDPGSVKAVIAVNIFGQPADYQKLEELSQTYNFTIIEDAAQSFGATYHQKTSCNLTSVGVTSFFPSKPLGCYGDGGAIFCDDDEMAEILKSIRVHGRGENKYDNVRTGLNGRLNTLQAAVLLEKIRIFDQELEQRNQVAAYYHQHLNDLVETPNIKPDRTSAWAQYAIRSSDRSLIKQALARHQIPANIYYPKPLHLQGAFEQLNYQKGDFPVSEDTSQTILSLPFSPYLEKAQQDFIIEKLAEVYQAKVV